MKTLKSSLTSFSMPSPEVRAEADRRRREADEAERGRLIAERVKASGIPERFRVADISTCPGAVGEWVEAVRSGEYANLAIQGKVGRGKTYSACAALIALAPDRRVLFSKFSNIIDEIHATYSGRGTEEDVKARYANAPVLCIDELGKCVPRENTINTLFDIIDDRSARMLPTAFTSQYQGKELVERLSFDGDQEYAKAILSRLAENAFRVEVIGEDRRRS